MDRKKLGKFYFWMVAAIFVGGLLYAGVTLKNVFPFYPWTMYAGSQTGDDYRVLRSMCTDSKGQQFSVTEIDLWYQQETYYSNLGDLENATLPLTPAQSELCRKEMERFYGDVSKDCQKLSLYRLYWKHFSGPKVDEPDERALLCEVGGSDARAF